MRRTLESLAALLDAGFDGARAALRRVLRRQAPMTIEPYLGFGSDRCLRFAGRVVRRRTFRPPDAAHPARRNALELLKRMLSGKVPRARLRARFGAQALAVAADSEGYFELQLTPESPLEADAWPVLALELVHPVPRDGPVRAEAQALVPSSSARFAVISDLDDTVVHSNVASRLRMLWQLARSNAHTRKPFAGVAALYRALEQGASGTDANPVFYVSNSPWNLYGPLVQFLEHQGIPGGPLMLRDFGDHTLFSMDAHGHKLSAIERIMEAYPLLSFVFIGDSGEQDPEIYAEVAQRHPERILAVYIREVGGLTGRPEAIGELAAALADAGVTLVLAPDSAAAAAHAAAHGLIAPHALHDVRAECERDARGARQLQESR